MPRVMATFMDGRDHDLPDSTQQSQHISLVCGAVVTFVIARLSSADGFSSHSCYVPAICP